MSDVWLINKEDLERHPSTLVRRKCPTCGNERTKITINDFRCKCGVRFGWGWTTPALPSDIQENADQEKRIRERVPGGEKELLYSTVFRQAVELDLSLE